MPEPWLRGTLTEVPAVARGVLHALHLAQEELNQWCAALRDEEINARPADLLSVAFHVKHIAGSLDRLLTYAEGRQLSESQMSMLWAEADPASSKALLLEKLSEAIAASAPRVIAAGSVNLEQPRAVGRLMLPTSVGGLLVHIADHSQRHVGQAIITAKVVLHSRAEND
jgi:hypothetical protein